MSTQDAKAEVEGIILKIEDISGRIRKLKAVLADGIVIRCMEEWLAELNLIHKALRAEIKRLDNESKASGP